MGLNRRAVVGIIGSNNFETKKAERKCPKLYTKPIPNVNEIN
jgi:hypothetical protein